MSHGLMWLPLLVAFVVLTALGWLERRRQRLFLEWASESELSKLDGSGAARLKDGWLEWSSFEAGKLKLEGRFEVCKLELVELLALSSGDAPLTDESHGPCRLRLIGSGDQRDLAFADADRARDWIEQLMSRSRCEL